MSTSPKILAKNLKQQGSRCCVPGCSNRRGLDKLNNESRSYFGIPIDKKLRNLWKIAIRRANWDPKDHDKVCSDHFLGGSRTFTPGSDGYIPSIFEMKKKVVAPPRKTKSAQMAGKVEQLNHLVFSSPDIPVKKKLFISTDFGDHDYIKTKCDPHQEDEQYVELQKRILYLENELDSIKGKILSIDNVKNNDKDFQYWTNLPNYAVFCALSTYLKERCNNNLNYWKGNSNKVHEHFSIAKASKPGKNRVFSFENELFIILVKLKTGRLGGDLARSFGVSESYISKLSTTWLNFLCFALKELFEMKCDLDNIENIPECFKGMTKLLIVLDCTELVVERSTNLLARKQTYSNYKNRDTAKFLVGMSPNLTTNYVSAAYGGKATDNHITRNSTSLIDTLRNNPKCKVMADRGFTINKELSDMGVELIIPDFKGRHRSQMSINEINRSASIAEMRIHVERLIQRIRTFHIWDSTIKLSQKEVITQAFTVCAYLVNFQLPIIRN